MIRHRNTRILNRSPPLRALPSRANHCRDLPPAISRAVCLWDGVVWGQLPRRACLGHPDDLARLVPASRGLIALGLRSRERPLSRVHAECRVQFNVLLHPLPFSSPTFPFWTSSCLSYRVARANDDDDRGHDGRETLNTATPRKPSCFEYLVHGTTFRTIRDDLRHDQTCGFHAVIQCPAACCKFEEI